MSTMCKSKIEIPIHLKEGLSAEEAAALTGLPEVLLKSEAYLARERPKVSDFPALWNGRKLIIPRQPLIAWLARQGQNHSRFDIMAARMHITSVAQKEAAKQ